MMSEDKTNGIKVIMNYRGMIFVSIEDADGHTDIAKRMATNLYDKLKMDYDSENLKSCLECAKENNIKSPEGPRVPEKTVNNEIQVVT